MTRLPHFALAAALLVCSSGAGTAAGSKADTATMLKLAPNPRAEQSCNERAMGVVSREHKDMRPDELVAYAFADTRIRDHRVLAPGAAVRSRGHWYHMTYDCQTTDDAMDVRAFSYTLGDMVPPEDWAEHSLVP